MIRPALILLVINLSACALLNPRDVTVSGKIQGFTPDQHTRLALVSYVNGQYAPNATRALPVPSAQYTLTLPRTLPSGIYRVVIFRDANGNERYDTGETVLSSDQGKRLIQAAKDSDLVTGTRQGWNLWNTINGEIQTSELRGYDLGAG